MENFIVSARKYRPATFDTVVGQESITSTLKNAIRNNTLAQAFLFCGPRGVGKTTCARIMAKTINCLHPTENLEACDECESCKAFNSNNSFNIYELDAASNNSVEDIRNLVEQVRIPPQIGKYKVYIIDEVHMLSSSAFNAFLKTLEEPPAYAKFILATTEKHKIIPTILSRCQIFDFKRITVEDISKHLAYVSSRECVTTEPEALNIIAQKADGALRDALSIFDQMVSFSGKTITYKDVIENLNVLDYDYYFKIVDDILCADTSDILILLEDIIGKGFEPQHFISGMGSHLRNLLVSKDTKTTQLLEVSEQLRQRYAEQSARCPMPFLIKALDINNQSDIDYRSCSNKRLHLEIALLKMCALCSRNLNVSNSPQPQQLPQNNPFISVPVTPAATQPTVPRQTVDAPASRGESLTNVSKPHPETNSNQATQTKQTEQTPNTDNQATPTQTNAPTFRPRSTTTSTISINPMSNTEPKEEETEPIYDTPFTQEQLSSAWESFVVKYKNISPSFAAGLGKYLPELKNQKEIYFTVDNILIGSDTENMSALRHHLKNELHNNQFDLIPKITDKPIEVKAYTDTDKFEEMVKAQPILKDLQLGLKLEGDL